MVTLVELQKTVSAPNQADITDEEAGALGRATINLFARWNLSDGEARELLGGLPQRTWARWKAGDIGRIDRDLRSRMAILMGIHKGLRYVFQDPARGYAWIRKPNTVFGGRSALEVMLQGQITDLVDVRTYLDAERGAW
ncbi:MAG: MbcA/ParS/Xre antitoxin family protein [Pseudomonadota bacterium]|nr:MbcA/ParS/Xre antitoxin family protein [Pseudomonadota bacterium]